MKYLFLSIVAVFLITGIGFTIKDGEMADLFPDLQGWQKKRGPDVYTPDNLFEYINGAAEVYLNYDFQVLATLDYANQKQAITVDIYRHNNVNNGFGIYSQEKPLEGEFIPIGTQGYYEKGVLNFFQGQYYIKMNSFGIQGSEKDLLMKIGGRISRLIHDRPGFPKVLGCFPVKGKVMNSERYISKNFLGHRFLRSAFVSEYKVNDKTFQIFIMEASNSKDAESILKSYLTFIKEKGIAISGDGFYRFQDPYYRSRGMMNMKWQGKFLWGLFSNDGTKAESYLKEIQTNLRKKGLI